MVPEVSPDRFGKPPGALLGPSWPATSLSWRALGRSFSALGPLLSWTTLDRYCSPKFRKLRFPHRFSTDLGSKNEPLAPLKPHSKCVNVVKFQGFRVFSASSLPKAS